MGADYYSLLDLKRDANDDEIKRAYKRAAVKWHPDKNPNNREYAEDRFKQVAEAYSVLSNPNKRAIYDQYGEEGLTAGGGMPAAADVGSQYAQMDSEAARRLFEQFFGGFGGSSGPFGFSDSSGRGTRGPTQFQFFSTGPGGGSAAFSSSGNPFGSSRASGMPEFFGMGGRGPSNNSSRPAGPHGGFFGSESSEEDMSWEAGDTGSNPFAAFGMAGGMNGAADSFFQHSQQQRQRQRPGSSSSTSGGWAHPRSQQQQQVQLPLSLEELYTGCIKRLKVTRHMLDAASGKSMPVQELLEIQVKPGWKEGTKLTFSGKGDELAPGGPSADLVFIIKQQPHPQFQRTGNDLYTTVKIPLVTALTGGTAPVQLLDGKSLDIPVSPPVNHGEVRVLKGQGMPVSKEQGLNGDLFVKLEVAFPAQLSTQQKEQLRRILPTQ